MALSSAMLITFAVTVLVSMGVGISQSRIDSARHAVEVEQVKYEALKAELRATIRTLDAIPAPSPPPVSTWCSGCDELTTESKMKWVAGSHWLCADCRDLVPAISYSDVHACP